ncbi:DNA translocase FtsK [Spiroplasma endosymbiont of Aspidapion aeneum]|uniref:DNA translocase FtsK n=1 Tax=Spiroplasma endosymbiont of Aspidapion aeneum TaxID=3066276 RepID=UPI00313CFDA9
MGNIDIDINDINKSLKNDTRTIALEIQKTKKKPNSNFFIIFGIVMFFLTIVSISRITIVGQALDDFLFSLPFGWLKYFIYLILIILNISIFFGVKFYFKKRFIAMIFSVFVVFCWNITSILIIVAWGTKNKDFVIGSAYSSESFNYIINSYCNYWKNHSLWDNYSGKWWITRFNTYSNAYAGGGIIGAFCSGIACYSSIFGNLFFSLFFLFIVLCWILTGDAFFLLKKKKYRRGRALRILSLTKDKKNNKKNNKKNRILNFVNIYGNNDGAKAEVYQSRMDYDLTIEMPRHLFREKEKYFDEEHTPEMYANGENISNIRQKVDVNSEIYESPFFKYGDRGYANINSDIDININNPNVNLRNRQNQGFINFDDSRVFAQEDNFIKKSKESEIQNENANFHNIPELNQINFNKNNKKQFYVPRRQTNSDFSHHSNNESETISYDILKKRDELSRQAELKPFGNKSHPDKNTITQVTLDSYEEREGDLFINTSSSVEEFVKTNRGDLDDEYIDIRDVQKKYFKEDNSKKLSVQKKYVIATNYSLPQNSILRNTIVDNSTLESAKIYARRQAESINTLFIKSKTDAKITNILIGPSVVKLEVSVGETGRVKDVLKLENDIKYSLATNNVIIQAPVEGKEAVGIEFPSNVILPVTFKEAMEKIPSNKSFVKLTFPIGKGVDNKWVFAQLEQTPHILIAGSTGSGKSVMVNSMICAFLMHAKPHEVKFLMIDPKRVELAYYENIPHLLTPVISDMSLAANALSSAVDEMERRYSLFNEKNVKHIEQYNSVTSERTKKLPYIVIVVDELADLMMSGAKKEVESSIQRLTQMARACGMHLIIATQRPSVDVITGIIKSNIPSRISFSVSSSVDSRTILDRTGGESLNGKGDMLYDINGIYGFSRAQGCYITDDEIKSIVDHTKNQASPVYDESFLSPPKGNSSLGNKHSSTDYSKDPLFKEVLNYVINQEATSTSDIQRRFKIGYNKAASFIDIFYDDGLVGEIGSGANQKRKVLVK